MLDKGFYVIVLDKEGRIIDYEAPLDLGFEKVKEAVQLGYEIYRAVTYVLRSLGYSELKSMTIYQDSMEIVILPRQTHIVLMVYSEATVPTGITENAVEAEA